MLTAPSVVLLGATQLALAQAKCTVNGREVPCEEAARQLKTFLGFGLGALVLVFAIIIAAAVFWIMMLVHAASHQIDNKAMWIILMVFTGIIGALAYYVVVKRKFNQKGAAISSTGSVMPPPSSPLMQG